MADLIHLLPDAIANQIAAGEVVQRPASAVKELMENSIDAGARRIQVIIKDAGRTLIHLIDDGSGMSETDARMSLERHATSKIRTADDLFTLRTMGFRGEALASIAAVSQMELKTRRADRDLGTRLVVEGSEVKRQEPTAMDPGTSIAVKNLFYNIPARRNFLKSNPVEMRHIVEEFQRIALAHPDVSFSLTQGDEPLYDLEPANLAQRIVALFGKTYQQQLAPCSEQTDQITVTGFVGKPDSAKRTRGEQYIFVNERFIRNNYLNHAVAGAYESLLPEGTFPFYVLFLTIDPRHIDVNVHPTKTEIKFDDERAVYAVVRAAVRQALGAHNLAPSIDYSADINLVSKLNQSALSHEQYLEEQLGSNRDRSNLRNWERLFEDEQPTQSALFGQTEIVTSDRPASLPVPEKVPVFQLPSGHLVRPARNGVMIIDPVAAHERVLFEAFQRKLRDKSGSSIQSLFPQSVTFGTADFTLLMEIEKDIKALGFEFEVFGKNAVVVTGLPAEASGRSEKELLEGMLEQFKQNQSALAVPIQENLARSLARRAAIRNGQALGQGEMETLVERLFASHNPNYSPDGRTTFFIFETSKIETYFR